MRRGPGISMCLARWLRGSKHLLPLNFFQSEKSGSAVLQGQNIEGVTHNLYSSQTAAVDAYA